MTLTELSIAVAEALGWRAWRDMDASGRIRLCVTQAPGLPPPLKFNSPRELYEGRYIEVSLSETAEIGYWGAGPPSYGYDTPEGRALAVEMMAACCICVRPCAARWEAYTPLYQERDVTACGATIPEAVARYFLALVAARKAEEATGSGCQGARQQLPELRIAVAGDDVGGRRNSDADE